MGKEITLTETQKKFLLEIRDLPDEAIHHLLRLVKTIKEALQIETVDHDIHPQKKRNIPQEILKALDAPPHLDIQDVEELRRVIKEGKQPVRFEDPFSR